MNKEMTRTIGRSMAILMALLIFCGCFQPTVKILSPENGQYFEPEQEIIFQASAIDHSGNQIGDAGIVWTSNKDGQLGIGTSFSRNDLSLGNHKITVTATDDQGKVRSKSIYITVGITSTTTTTTIPVPIKIIIDGISPYGEDVSEVWGHIEGIAKEDYQNFGVSCIIEVEDVWWSKPFADQLISTIAYNGTFRININTGGADRCAKKAHVCLVPIDSKNVPNCGPCFVPTGPVDALSFDAIDRAPIMRSVNFSGYDFNVKYGDCQIGPGPNYFSDDIRDVFVDEAGLHLTIKQRDGRWLSTEVIGQNSFGYGTYTFVINSRIDILDPNVVLGIFTWDETAYTKSYREIDIEFAKWGLASNLTNSQFVLQPCSACPGCGGNCSRYLIDLNDDKYLTCYLVWQAGEAQLRTYYGNYQGISPPANALVSEYVFSGEGVPEPGEAKIRFNLWLFHGSPPTNGLPEEVIIESFFWQEGNMGW